jgi:hypothetical protein
MKTVARYLDTDNNGVPPPSDGRRTAFDGSYVSTLIKPKQIFVNGVVGYDATKDVGYGLLEIDITLLGVNAFTLTQGADTATAISTIIVASDNDVVDSIYVLIYSLITTRSTSIDIKASGARIDGNATSLNVGGLTPNQSYYGWVMAVDKSGNESLIVASTPAILKTDGGVLGDTMFDTDLNAAYSLRKLFRQYTGPHIRVKRSGVNAELDVTFNSDGLVVTPSDWATWSFGRTILVPTIYDQSGNGRHAIMTDAIMHNKSSHQLYRVSVLPTLLYDASIHASERYKSVHYILLAWCFK